MIRLQDIADMAGVSRTTVANVLHGRTKRVSRETINKITEILKEVEYVPHMGSLLLTHNKSKIIGLVIKNSTSKGFSVIQDPFIGEMTGVLHEGVEKLGYYLMLISGQKKENIIDIASRWNVDGLVLFGFSEKEHLELRKKLNKPMVAIDMYAAKESRIVNVGTDDYNGGYLAGKYLLKMGHKDMLYLAEHDINSAHSRWLGLQKAFEEAGIFYDDTHRILLPHHEYGRMQYYKTILSRLLQAGAVFCYSDYIGVEVINYCNDMGIHVPGELSVIGFDDTKISKIVRPQLTTVRQNIEDKALLALDKVLCLINNEAMKEIDTKIPVELIVRDSVSNKRKKID